MFRSAFCVLLVLVFASGDALASGPDAPFARDAVQASAATAAVETPVPPSRLDADAAVTLRSVMRLAVMFAVGTFALALVDFAAMGLLERLRPAEDPQRDTAGEPLRLDAVLHS